MPPRGGFFPIWDGFSRLMHLEHIWHVFLLWRISSYTRWVFSTHASQAYLDYASTMADFFSREMSFLNSSISSTFGLYLCHDRFLLTGIFGLCLCHDEFLLVQVRFSWLMRLGHILALSLVVTNFFSHRLNFLNLCVLGIFGLFLHHVRFILTRLGFLGSRQK